MEEGGGNAARNRRKGKRTKGNRTVHGGGVNEFGSQCWVSGGGKKGHLLNVTQKVGWVENVTTTGNKRRGNNVGGRGQTGGTSLWLKEKGKGRVQTAENAMEKVGRDPRTGWGWNVP